jgi:hypothetical protein
VILHLFSGIWMAALAGALSVVLFGSWWGVMLAPVAASLGVVASALYVVFRRK